MVSFNKVIVAGNLTRDPELKFTNDGIPVCEFGLAQNKVRGDKEHVNFFDVTVWRELGETVANYKKKGDPVLVEGELKYRSWEAQDGSKRSKIDITAENIQFLGRNGNGENGSSGSGGSSRAGGRAGNEHGEDIPENDFEDIPFSADPRSKTRAVRDIL